MNNRIGQVWEFHERNEIGWAVLLVVSSRVGGGTGDYCIHDLLVLDGEHFFPVGSQTCWGDAMFEDHVEAWRIT